VEKYKPKREFTAAQSIIGSKKSKNYGLQGRAEMRVTKKGSVKVDRFVKH